MADPSELTDEELNKVIETGVEPETPESEVIAPPEQEPLKEEEPEESKVPAEQAPAESEPEETPAAPSRREQLRVQTLLKKYGPPPEQNPKSTGKDYRELIEADDEVIKTLESDRQQSNKESFNQGLDAAKFFKWETLLQVDAPGIETKYPQLDKNSPQFHPALADAMNTKYLRFVGYDAEKRSVNNPDIRYSDFVEAEMEFADEIAAQRVEKTTQNIVKQAAQTGLRPDGSITKKLNLNQAPSEMSLEELYASIGQTAPKQ